MKDIPLTHFYSWQMVPDAMAPLVLSEFADNGAKYFVLSDGWGPRLLHELGFYNMLKNWQINSGMAIFECHAPWGAGYDLNIRNKPRRPGMIEDHKMCMEYAADFGCKTYTVHIGGYYPGMEDSVCDALEQLIPTAEKLGIIIAIENGMDPGYSPDALLYYLKKYTSPSVGCCLDTGHANVMLSAPGKKLESYPISIKDAWNQNIQQEPDPIGKLADYIVTVHLHDNDGYSDQHGLPGTGTIDWKNWIPKLKQCPRLVSFQNEFIASRKRFSIKKICQTYEELVKL